MGLSATRKCGFTIYSYLVGRDFHVVLVDIVLFMFQQ